jgi:phosphonate transport system permease protein
MPPAAAAVASIVPGLGHLLLGQIRRGLLILGSFASIALMADWRVHIIAPDRASELQTWQDALARRPLFVLLVLVATIVAWALVALDARSNARKVATPRKAAAGGPADRRHLGIFAVILGIFFVLGWQISEIDPIQMVRDLPDAWPPLAKVLWPWKAAVTRDTQALSAAQRIAVPCGEQDPPAPEPRVAGKPWLDVSPRCGELSRMDEKYQLVPGTLLTVKGQGFRPDTDTEIWWIDPLENSFRMRKEGQYLLQETDSSGAFELTVNMPYAMVPQQAGKQDIHRIEARQISTVGGLKPSEPLRIVVSRMVETIVMGMMATLFGIVLSIPVSFLASRNLMSHSPVTLAIYYLTRFVLNVVRAIEPLIWALIAVVWVGLGPFAGIIALTVHSVASLGKLYSEAIEGIDPGPIEAIQATGATRLQTIAYAVVPQMIPPFVSFSIYRWDINVRMSTVIGLVGGGGVGFILVQYIRLLDYRSAGIAVWFIAFTVAVLDYVSSEIRQRFV